MITRGSSKLVTPPTTPPWAALKGSSNGNSKFPTTPPPVRKHSTGIQKSDCVLIKSKSHESELTNRINPGASTNAVVKDIPISPTTTTPTATVSTSAVTAPATETPIKSALNCGNPGLMSTVSSSSYTISTNSSTAMRSSVSDMPLSSTSGGDPDNNLSNMSHVPVFRQKRLQTEPTLDTTGANIAIASGYDGHSPVASPRSPPNLFDANEMMMGHSSTLQVPPKSPRTPRSMGHLIKHRFTKTFKPGKCDHCSEYMFNGLKCKECKFRCHRDCESQVPPSCGLPEDLLRHYISQITKEGSPIMPMRLPSGMGASADPAILARFAPGFAGSSAIGASQGGAALNPHYLDSSSNTSSCNSSTPSSPAVVLVTSHPTPPHSASMYQNAKTKFMFPDTPAVMKMAAESSQNQQQSTMNKPSSPNPIIDSVKSYDSDKTLSLSGKQIFTF